MKILLGLSGERVSGRAPGSLSGVGMIKSEFLCRQAGDYITSPRVRSYIVDYCREICQIFSPLPVWYRLIDMETSEINKFTSADVVLNEKTTMLGLRGVRRSLAYPETFRAEARMLTSLSQEFENINVIVPFLARAEEYREASKVLKSEGFANTIGMMAETPASILTLQDFLEVSSGPVFLGLNDLTSLTIGAERRSAAFDVSHPAVEKMITLAKRATLDAGSELYAAGNLRNQDVTWLHRLGCHVVLPFAEARDSPWNMDLTGDPVDTEAVLAGVRRMQSGDNVDA